MTPANKPKIQHGGKNKNMMNVKTLKTKALGIFLTLALVLSMIAVTLPATPVKADVTAVTITTVAGPVLSNPAYVGQGGPITVSGTVTDDGAWGTPCPINFRVEIYNATTTIADSGTLTRTIICDGTPQPILPTLSVNISATAAAGTYNVRVTAQNSLGGGQIIATSLSSVIVDTTLPTVTIITPNGGNYIAADQAYTVRWNATDTIPPTGDFTVSALYNTDGSTTFPSGNVVFAAGTFTKGENSATWPAANIPDVDTSTAKLQLTVVDSAHRGQYHCPQRLNIVERGHYPNDQLYRYLSSQSECGLQDRVLER